MKYLSVSLLALCMSSACYSAKPSAEPGATRDVESDAALPDPAPSKPRRDAPVETPKNVKPSQPVGNPVDAGTKAMDAGKTSTRCEIDQSPIQKLDLLFVVDNSNSMAQEQEALRAAFPHVIEALATGQRSPDGAHPFPAATDMHVGVVTTDMGIPGVNFGAATNCRSDGGDDGKFQHTPHGDGCASMYPSFLSYSADGDLDPAAFAHDLGCIAAVGTGGCGFEQQLEAPLKALWPSIFQDSRGNVVTPNPILFLATTSQGTLGRGDLPIAQGGNLGFLRNDPKTGLSLIAIVLVTDEEDCSSRTTEHLRPKDQYPPDSPYYNEDLNMRCYYNPQLLYDVTNRYLKGFQLLRQGNEQLVLFAAIAGVPTDLVDEAALAEVDFSDDASRTKFYDGILADDRMTEKPDPNAQPGMGILQPACARLDVTGNLSTAFPARRIVTLAKGFAENGMVQSICQDDFNSAFDPIIDLIARRLGSKPECPR